MSVDVGCTLFRGISLPKDIIEKRIIIGEDISDLLKSNKKNFAITSFTTNPRHACYIHKKKSDLNSQRIVFMLPKDTKAFPIDGHILSSPFQSEFIKPNNDLSGYFIKDIQTKADYSIGGFTFVLLTQAPSVIEIKPKI